MNLQACCDLEVEMDALDDSLDSIQPLHIDESTRLVSAHGFRPA